MRTKLRGLTMRYDVATNADMDANCINNERMNARLAHRPKTWRFNGLAPDDQGECDTLNMLLRGFATGVNIVPNPRTRQR